MNLNLIFLSDTEEFFIQRSSQGHSNGVEVMDCNFIPLHICYNAVIRKRS